MGASVCWSYIDLFGPQALAGMVGVDQTPRMVNNPDWSHGFFGLTEGNMGTFFADGVPPTHRGRAVERSAAAIAALQSRVGQASLFHSATLETRPLLDDHARQDWRDVIATAQTPMLLVAGQESQLWPCEHCVAAAAPNPLVRAVIIPDAGHATNIDQPEAFNAELVTFLQGALRKS
jgi:pimeloyl-ACP methyl ester carboxylesterase